MAGVRGPVLDETRGSPTRERVARSSSGPALLIRPPTSGRGSSPAVPLMRSISILRRSRPSAAGECRAAGAWPGLTEPGHIPRRSLLRDSDPEPRQRSLPRRRPWTTRGCPSHPLLRQRMRQRSNGRRPLAWRALKSGSQQQLRRQPLHSWRGTRTLAATGGARQLRRSLPGHGRRTQQQERQGVHVLDRA